MAEIRDTKSQSDDVEELIHLIFATGRLIKEHPTHRSVLDSCSMLQREVLRFVSEAGTPTMREIAKYFSITPPSTTTLVGGLVTEGQLRRVADKDDRRMIRLAITSKGKQTLTQSLKLKSLRLREVLGKLDALERKNLALILEKLARLYRQ